MKDLFQILYSRNFSDKSFIETINYYKENKCKQDNFYNEKTKILLSGKNVRILKFDNFKNELDHIFLKHNIPIKLRGKKKIHGEKQQIQNLKIKIYMN